MKYKDRNGKICEDGLVKGKWEPWGPGWKLALAVITMIALMSGIISFDVFLTAL